jgi:hypothetical protein
MTNTAARGTDEAVLDSIRRLLSDGRPVERSPAPPAAANEKLLLTPALRVGKAAPAEPAPRPRSEPAAWSLEDRIAELEAAVGDRADDWEPDGSEDADQERPSRFLFQHRPPPRETEPRGMAEAAAPAPVPPSVPRARVDLVDEADLRAREDDDADDGFDIFEDDRLPDPDALRDLVAEIVRQELQSDLGQRVTRNIRKLVRREIRRALAARDFD